MGVRWSVVCDGVSYAYIDVVFYGESWSSHRMWDNRTEHSSKHILGQFLKLDMVSPPPACD